jgi:hypothetical protein
MKGWWPHAPGAQVVQVHEFGSGAADDERQADRRRDGVELRAGLDPDQEDRIDAGGLVGADPGDGVLDAGQRDRAAAPDDHQLRVPAPGECGAHLADPLLERGQAGLAARAEGLGQLGILDREPGHAGHFQLFHRALHVERVAVAVVGVDHQRQVAGAADALRLGGELGEREHDQIGRAQHGHRGHGAGEHAELEAQVLGDARGNGIEHRTRMDATRARQNPAKSLTSCRPAHVSSRHPVVCPAQR